MPVDVPVSIPTNLNLEEITFRAALIFSVIAFVKEWVIPGAREKRMDERLNNLEEAVKKMAEAQETGNEITEEVIKMLKTG